MSINYRNGKLIVSVVALDGAEENLHFEMSHMCDRRTGNPVDVDRYCHEHFGCGIATVFRRAVLADLEKAWDQMQTEIDNIAGRS